MGFSFPSLGGEGPYALRVSVGCFFGGGKRYLVAREGPNLRSKDGVLQPPLEVEAISRLKTEDDGLRAPIENRHKFF